MRDGFRHTSSRHQYYAQNGALITMCINIDMPQLACRSFIFMDIKKMISSPLYYALQREDAYR